MTRDGLIVLVALVVYVLVCLMWSHLATWLRETLEPSTIDALVWGSLGLFILYGVLPTRYTKGVWTWRT